MSAAVVHHPRTMLPKFNFLLAGGAVVLSIIAITDNVGSNTATGSGRPPRSRPQCKARSRDRPPRARSVQSQGGPTVTTHVSAGES